MWNIPLQNKNIMCNIVFYSTLSSNESIEMKNKKEPSERQLNYYQAMRVRRTRKHPPATKPNFHQAMTEMKSAKKPLEQQP